MSTGYWAEGKGMGSHSDLWMSLEGWRVAGFLITVVANLMEVTDGGEVCLVSVFQGYSHGGGMGGACTPFPSWPPGNRKLGLELEVCMTFQDTPRNLLHYLGP